MKTSVVVCTYNGEKYIAEQLESIINQSVCPDEIVVCDDKSKDNTVEIVKGILSKSRIDYSIIVNESNMGVTKNFEQGIQISKGDIVFLSDQDDVWRNDKIEKIIKIFKENDKCVIAFSNAVIVDAYGKITGNKLWKVIGFNPDRIDRYGEIFLKKSLITGATMAVKRNFCMKIMPFPKSWIHDGWIAINGEIYGSINYVDEELINYRIHNDNVVGANAGIKKKILSYLANTVNMKNERIIRYKRYKVFYSRQKKTLKTEYKKSVKRCILFWKDMMNLSKERKISSVVCILKNLCTCNYSRYYTGLRGAIRDIFSLK